MRPRSIQVARASSGKYPLPRNKMKRTLGKGVRRGLQEKAAPLVTGPLFRQRMIVLGGGGKRGVKQVFTRIENLSLGRIVDSFVCHIAVGMGHGWERTFGRRSHGRGIRKRSEAPKKAQLSIPKLLSGWAPKSVQPELSKKKRRLLNESSFAQDHGKRGAPGEVNCSKGS